MPILQGHGIPFADVLSLSLVQVVAPLAPFDVRPERDLSNRFTPLSLCSDDDGTPTLGSIHRINLDRCPTFKLAKNLSKFNWCDLHVSLMFSELEKERMFRAHTESPALCSSSPTPTPDTLRDIKQTLHILLRSAAGAVPDGAAPEKVFALCDTSLRRGVPYLYIIVARMCLDVGSHTMVADAFVAPGTPAVRAALGTALYDQRPRKPDDTAIRYIGTDADETAA